MCLDSLIIVGVRLSAKWCGGGGGFYLKKFYFQANSDSLIYFI